MTPSDPKRTKEATAPRRNVPTFPMIPEKKKKSGKKNGAYGCRGHY
jgi:hypothetical protein